METLTNRGLREKRMRNVEELGRLQVNEQGQFSESSVSTSRVVTRDQPHDLATLCCPWRQHHCRSPLYSPARHGLDGYPSPYLRPPDGSPGSRHRPESDRPPRRSPHVAYTH